MQRYEQMLKEKREKSKDFSNTASNRYLTILLRLRQGYQTTSLMALSELMALKPLMIPQK